MAVVLSLIASMFSPVIPAMAQEEDPYKLVLRVGTRDSVIAEGAVPKTDYFTGEQIPATARFEASGTLVDLQNPTIRIVVPKIAPVNPDVPNTADKYLTKPDFVSSGQAVAERRGEDATSWWIEYDFLNIKGGTNLEYPFPFRFRNLVTPDGTTVTPVVTLLDGNGDILLEESVTFTAKASSEYTSEKRSAVGPTWTSDNEGKVHPETGERAYELPTYRTYQTVEAFEAAKPLLDAMPTDTLRTYRICAVNRQQAGASAGVGEYRAQTLKIVDRLPEHAKWLPNQNVNRGWVYDEATHTATFTGRITTDANSLCKQMMLDFSGAPISENGYTCNAAGTDCSTVGPAILHVNYAQVTLDEGLESEEIHPEVKWDHTFHVRHVTSIHRAEYRNNFEKYVTDHERVNRPHSYFNGDIWDRTIKVDSSRPDSLVYRIRFGNTNNGQTFKQPGLPVFGGTHDFIQQIEDKQLDERLYIQGITFDVTGGHSNTAPERTQAQTRQSFIDAGPKLYGVLADGSEELIPEEVKPANRIVLNDTERKYTGWKLKFDNPLEIDNFDLYSSIYVYPTVQEMKDWADGKYTGQQKYYNGAQITYQTGRTPHTQQTDENGNVTWVPGELQMNPEIKTTKYDYQEDNNWISITPVTARIRQVSSNNQTVTYVNCERDLGTEGQLTTANCSRLREFRQVTTSDDKTLGRWAGMTEPAKNFKQIVLLPPGVEYRYTNGTAPTTKIIPNFRNTGKTAVVYEYGDVDMKVAKTALPVLDTTLYANDGANVVEFYSVWDNNESEIGAHADQSRYQDTLDLDGDGNTTEYFLKTTNTITFIPPAEVLMKKMVSLDGKAWMLEAPAQDLGGDLYYKLTIANGDRVPLRRVFIIDVLPHLQDHTIVDGQLPDGGVGYAPRWWNKVDPETGEVTRVEHSAYTTPLVKAIEDVEQNAGLTKFTFLYSVTPQGADLASVRDAEWLTKDAFVAQYGNTPEAWAKVTSFKTQLKDGQQLEPKESANIVVQSVIPYNDATKQLEVGSKAVNSGALSTTNVGYLEANNVRSEIVKYSVEGIVWVDSESDSKAGEQERRLEGYKVQLIDATTGEVATAPDGTPYEKTTDAKGHYWFDVYKRGNYKVQFTLQNADTFTEYLELSPEALRDEAQKRVDSHAQPADEKDTQATTDTFSLNPDVVHEIRNAGIILGTVPVTLAKVDEFCVPVEGVKFVLTWDRPLEGQNAPAEKPGPFPGTSDKDGNITFENVPMGVYQLTEDGQSTPQRLQTLQGAITVTVNDQGVTHTAGELSTGANEACAEAKREFTSDIVVENQVKRGSVKIVKQDADRDGIKLEGAVFQLLDAEGNEILDPKTNSPRYVSSATNEQGETIIEGVLWGEYKLKEVTPPANYLPSAELIDIRIADHEQVVERVVENTVFKGSVKAQKIGRPINEPLAGVEFTLTPKDAPGAQQLKATTGADGVVIFNDVRYGTYILRESKSLENYQLSAETDGREVKVEQNGQEVDLTDPFFNDMKRGSLSLTKVDADHTQQPLAGATFGLFAQDRETARNAYLATRAEGDATDPTTDPNWAWENLELYTAASGVDGKVEFPEVVYGNYTLKETATAESHILLDKTFPVSIDRHGKHIDLGSVENVVKRADVKIVKHNAWADSLEGAEFELRQGEQVVATASTDANGVAVFERVAFGDYTVVETVAPAGYQLNGGEPVAVAVRDEGVTVDLTATPVVNPIITGSVKLHKVSGDDGTDFAGATFGLFPVDQTTARNAVKESVRSGAQFDAGVLQPGDEDNPDWDWQSAPAYIATSAADGSVIFDGVVYGTYELREISTKDSHVLLSAVVKVTISEQGQVVDAGTIENFLKRGSIELRKVDSSGAPLQGATFELRREGTAVATAISDATGLVRFADVPYGEYAVVETKAPAGYLLDKQERLAAIVDDGELYFLGDVVNVEVGVAIIPGAAPNQESGPENHPDGVGQKKPRALALTGFDASTLLLLALAVTALGALIVAIRKKKA
ncbi:MULTISPECIES: SpaA isopeptide-forming pilin-related protein [unclassified Corynebacterium]|uniref:SpaA isopeptide-forming pilin-related protein n=2 Tax=unclassified Corynebacterium TaxID=2624378 RepID=UPI00211BEF8A